MVGGRNHLKLKLGLVIHANSNNALHPVKIKCVKYACFPRTCTTNCLLFSLYSLKSVQIHSRGLDGPSSCDFVGNFLSVESIKINFTKSLLRNLLSILRTCYLSGYFLRPELSGASQARVGIFVEGTVVSC